MKLMSRERYITLKKILIVDDMLVSLMMTENILATQYITVCANSAAEAIEKYRAEKPDMVLSDLRMPGMNGYELQLALQEEYHQVIPFMFMTADHDEETESKGFENGAMDFIRKPFRPDVLLRRIANILQTVEQIQGLKKYASTATNVKKITPHKLRSTFGTDLYRKTGDIYLVADVLGHKDVNVTRKHYADMSEDKRRLAAELTDLRRLDSQPSSSDE